MAISPENEAIRQLEAKLVTEVQKSLDDIVVGARRRKLITDNQKAEIMEVQATKQQKAQKFMDFILDTVKDSANFYKFCELLCLPGCIGTQTRLAQELSKQVASYTLLQHVYILSG